MQGKGKPKNKWCKCNCQVWEISKNIPWACYACSNLPCRTIKPYVIQNWDPLRAMNWWPCLALPHVLFSTKTTIPRLIHHEKATSKCLGFQISIFLDGSWFITHKWDNQIAMSSMKLLVVFGVDLKISTVLIPKSLHESPNTFHQILSHTSHQLPFWSFARKCAMSESLGLQSLFPLGGKNAHQILRQLFITSLGGKISITH